MRVCDGAFGNARYGVKKKRGFRFIVFFSPKNEERERKKELWLLIVKLGFCF